MARPKKKRELKSLFSKRLNVLFADKNILEFERKYGLSNGQIGRFLDGVEPQMSSLEAIIKGTGCSASWLIFGEGEMMSNHVGSQRDQGDVGIIWARIHQKIKKLLSYNRDRIKSFADEMGLHRDFLDTSLKTYNALHGKLDVVAEKLKVDKGWLISGPLGDDSEKKRFMINMRRYRERHEKLKDMPLVYERTQISKSEWGKFETGETMPTTEQLSLIAVSMGDVDPFDMINRILDDDLFSDPSLPINTHEYNALRLHDYDQEERETQCYGVVGEGAAFEGGGAVAGAMGEDDQTIWGEVAVPGSTHFVRVTGDSMSPVLLDGQYAMVGPEYQHGKSPKEGEIVIAEVVVKDEEQAGSDAPFEGVYCKRIRDGESTWLLESINPAYQVIPIHKHDCRLWPVIGVWFAGQGKPPKEN